MAVGSEFSAVAVGVGSSDNPLGACVGAGALSEHAANASATVMANRRAVSRRFIDMSKLRVTRIETTCIVRTNCRYLWDLKCDFSPNQDEVSASSMQLERGSVHGPRDFA